MKFTFAIIAALFVSGLVVSAQTTNTNPPANFASGLTIDPTISGGLQEIYDAVTVSTNYAVVTGGARATTGNRNVAFADFAYNFNQNVGLVIGYDYLWTSAKSGVPAQANLVKGGISLQANVAPLKQFGLTNVIVTPFASVVVATGNGIVGQIISGGAKTQIATIGGFNLNLGVLYEDRTGEGFWNGRYVGGFIALTKGF